LFRLADHSGGSGEQQYFGGSSSSGGFMGQSGGAGPMDGQTILASLFQQIFRNFDSMLQFFDIIPCPKFSFPFTETFLHS